MLPVETLVPCRNSAIPKPNKTETAVVKLYPAPIIIFSSVLPNVTNYFKILPTRNPLENGTLGFKRNGYHVSSRHKSSNQASRKREVIFLNTQYLLGTIVVLNPPLHFCLVAYFKSNKIKVGGKKNDSQMVNLTTKESTHILREVQRLSNSRFDRPVVPFQNTPNRSARNVLTTTKMVIQYDDLLHQNLHQSLTKGQLKLHPHYELFMISLVSFGTIGYLKVMPLSKPKLNESREVQSKAQSSYNDEYDRVSSHYTKNYKAEQVGCKQGTKFTFTKKYADEELGFSAKYQTQVKFKESVYPNKIGYSSSKSNYSNNQNCNSIWNLMRITSATEEFPKISM
ncbi:hypothetical protein ACFX15_044770 [Malus domestica]